MLASQDTKPESNEKHQHVETVCEHVEVNNEPENTKGEPNNDIPTRSGGGDNVGVIASSVFGT